MTCFHPDNTSGGNSVHLEQKRWIWASHRTAAAVAAITLVTGCGGPSSPTSPDIISPHPAAPQVHGTPAAVLEISTFEIQFDHTSRDAYYMYLPKVVLTETSGRSAALLNQISFFLPNGHGYDITSINSFYCLREGSRTVAAGAAWDTKLVIPWCLPLDSQIDLSGSTVRLTVSFADENGVPGEVTGSAIVARAR